MFISRLFFELYTRFVFFWYTPLKIVGQQKIPSDSGVLFTSNHNSHMDTSIIAVASGFGYNRLSMLAASDYWFDNPFRKFFFRLILNLIPIDRGKSKPGKEISLEQTLVYCRKFTAKPRHGIVMYPEGTRSRTGKLQKLKDGVSLFSVRLGVPIVPIYLKGSFEAWSKGKLFIRPKKIFAEILDPIYPDKIDEEFEKIATQEEKELIKNSKVRKVTAILTNRLKMAEKKHHES